MKRRDIFDSAPNWGVKSDVFRYEILFSYGGVYADTDFLCVRSLNELLTFSFFCGIVSKNEKSVNNALIGSISGHPLLDELLKQLKTPLEGYSSEATFQSTGPSIFSNVVYDRLAETPVSVHVLPYDAFYPMPNTFSRNKEPPWKKYVTEQTYAVHFWDYSWQKRSFLETVRKAFLKPVPKFVKSWIKKFILRKEV